MPEAPSYLDEDEYRTLTVLPSEYADQVELVEAGWIAAKLNQISRFVDARLIKRYAVPFTTPYPHTVRMWVAILVDDLLMLKRGVDSTDEQYMRIVAMADTAKDEIRQAADAATGLFELPLRSDTTAKGISKGAPLAHTEVSPYTWSQTQRAEAPED